MARPSLLGTSPDPSGFRPCLRGPSRLSRSPVPGRSPALRGSEAPRWLPSPSGAAAVSPKNLSSFPLPEGAGRRQHGGVSPRETTCRRRPGRPTVPRGSQTYEQPRPHVTTPTQRHHATRRLGESVRTRDSTLKRRRSEGRGGTRR